MVTRTILLAAAVALTLPATALGQSQPSADWNGNFQFRGQGERANDLLQADLIERQENGYYGQWTYYGTTNQTFNSTTNIDEYNNSGTQNSTTTSNVGSITSTTIEGDNNDLNSHSVNTNCGDVSGHINPDDIHSTTDGGSC